MLLGKVVPEGVAVLPPGPELAAALDRLDPALVPNDDIVDLLIARSRQLAHDQARLFEAMVEVLHRQPFAGPLEIRRGEAPELHSADEVRAALAWTRRAADAETDLAHAVVTTLPLVHAALLAGDIDRGKARVFAHHLCDLTPAQVELLCRAVLPAAGRLTTGQLAARLQRLIIEIDPGYYERRYRKAVRDRMLIGYLDPDGTATITAIGLPADEAAAALQRIDTLARDTRRAGHPATLDQLRADITLGLLEGTLHNQTRDQIIHTLLTHHAGDPDPDDDDDDDGGGPDDGGPDDGGPGAGGTSAGADQRAAVEVRVALSTLLGDDERPGEIPGLGPIPAGAARAAVARQRRAQWRWVIVDGLGQFVSAGITRRRPAPLSRSGPAGGIVELQVPETTLAHLAADPARCGPWVLTVVRRAHVGAVPSERVGA